jgi:hypothetical protein
MTDISRRFNRSGINAAVALLSVAFAIIICYAMDDWWLFVPVLLLEMGLVVLILGLSVGRARSSMPWARSDSHYYLFWGNLLAVIGALLIVNILLPGNVLILIVAFLIWMGVFALLFSMNRKAP